jgi:hypothetical protein
MGSVKIKQKEADKKIITEIFLKIKDLEVKYSSTYISSACNQYSLAIREEKKALKEYKDAELKLIALKEKLKR